MWLEDGACPSSLGRQMYLAQRSRAPSWAGGAAADGVEDRTGVEPGDGAVRVAQLARGELNVDPRVEGARDLILAIFRLAVADYLGLAFSPDGPGPARRTRRAPYVGQAGLFLASACAGYLADLIGLESPAIWREVRKLSAEHKPRRPSRPALAA